MFCSLKTIRRPDNVNNLQTRPTSDCVFWEEWSSEEQCQFWIGSAAAEHEGDLFMWSVVVKNKYVYLLFLFLQCFDAVGSETGRTFSLSSPFSRPFSRWAWVSRCLLKQRMMEVVSGDNWTTGAVSRAKLQPNHHHQQTNIQLFWQAGCPSCRPTNSVKALKVKYHIPWTVLTWGSSNFVCDH